MLRWGQPVVWLGFPFHRRVQWVPVEGRCVCTSSVPWSLPGLFPALCMGVRGRDNGICLFLCSLQQGLDLTVMLEGSSWSAGGGGGILCTVGGVPGLHPLAATGTPQPPV